MYESSDYELKKFFNTNGKRYKELGLKDILENETDDQKFERLAGDPMLVKRPIVAGNGIVLVGFKEVEWEATIQK